MPAASSIITLPVCRDLIHVALRRQRRHIFIKAGVGILGIFLTPILGGVVAMLMAFYIVIWIIVVATLNVAVEILLLVFGLWVLFYIVLMMLAWQRERTLRRFFYQSIERRPPPDLFPPLREPPYYIPLGPDLLEDDVPAPWLIRIPCFWTNIVIKALLQWQVWHFAATVDLLPAAVAIRQIAGAPEASLAVEALRSELRSNESLHSALCVLLILDLAELNTNWSRVWLNRSVREQLGLELSEKQHTK
ncbi:MAG: hypothetical protein ACP5I8_11990 [Phycisphaerae bacterium]